MVRCTKCPNVVRTEPNGWSGTGFETVSGLAAAVAWHPLSTAVNVRSVLFKRKILHHGLWDQSGTLNVRLSGGLTTLGHSERPVNHSEQSSEACSQAWWTRRRSDCVWGCVCVCVCVLEWRLQRRQENHYKQLLSDSVILYHWDNTV